MATTEPAAKKSKRSEDSERGQDFDAATQNALEQIDLCQNSIDELNEKCAEEILLLEQKYNEQRKPLYDKRGAIISTIPNFWITAMMNHPDLNALLDEAEEDCLHHLTNIEVEEFPDIKSGYQIKFHFGENPYFENRVLVKEFHLGGENPVSVSTQIQWKEGCPSSLRHAAGHKNNTSSGKRKHHETSTKTFFSWFTDNVDPSTDDIAESIKDDLWPHPLQYYLVPDQDLDENGVEGDEESDSSDEVEEEDGETNEAGKKANNGNSC